MCSRSTLLLKLSVQGSFLLSPGLGLGWALPGTGGGGVPPDALCLHWPLPWPLLAGTDRSQGDSYCLSIFTRHRTDTHTPFSKRELTMDAGCPGKPMCIAGTQAGVFQGRRLGKLGARSWWELSPCWEELLRVNNSPGFGLRPLEQSMTLWV